MNEEEKYKYAKKKVKDLKGFYSHLIVYFVINIFLVIINLISTPERIWFYWVTLGWGVAVVLNAVAVFGLGGLFGSDWEEKKIKKYLEKDN
jgi:hypothetical protein